MDRSSNFLNKLKSKPVVVESLEDISQKSSDELQDEPLEISVTVNSNSLPETSKTPVATQLNPERTDYENALDDDLQDELFGLILNVNPSSVLTRSEEVVEIASNTPVINRDASEEEIQEIYDGLEDAEDLLNNEDDTSIEDRFHREQISDTVILEKKEIELDPVVEQHQKDLAVLSTGLPTNPNYEWISDFTSRNSLTDKEGLEIWIKDTQKNADALSQAEFAEKLKKFKSKYQSTDPTEKKGKYLPICEEFEQEFHIPKNIDIFSREKCLDVAYDMIKDREKRTIDLLNVSKNNDRAFKRESEKALQRAKKRKEVEDEKAHSERILSGQEVGDKKRLQEAKQDQIDGYAMGMNSSDMNGESDESKMPETEYYYWLMGMENLMKVYPDSLEVVYSGSGRFGGIEFGWKTRFPFLNGLDNSDIYYYQSVTYCDKSLIDTLYALPGNARTFWMQLFNGSPNQSRISKFAPYVSNLKQHKTHSITGKKLAWKVIPPLEAFDEKVQQLDPYELLSLLPRAEADTFLIHLGRIAYGTNKVHVVDNMSYRTNEVVESNIALPYRAGICFHGDRNIGKSQLIELIVSALTLGGYSTRALGTTFNQFGRKPLTTADLGYIDDSVDKKIIMALTDDLLKTAMSGGTMDIEDKGKDGVERIARAALIMAVNRLCFPKNFDPGVANRFHFLQIHSEQQMNEMSAKAGQNMFPAALWDRLSKELDVDVRLFGLYLLRRGIERYLEVAGLDLQEDGTYKQVRTPANGKPGIEIQLEKNRANYVFQPPVEEKEYICSMSRRCFAITKYLEPGYLESMHPEYDNSFHAFTLLHTANVITRLQNEIEECDVVKAGIVQFAGDPKLLEWQNIKQNKLKTLLQWVDPKGMIPTATWIQLRRFWQTKASSGQEIGDTKKFTLEAIWDEFASLVTTFDGRSIEPIRYEWTPAFLSSKNNTQGFLTEIETILNDFVKDLADAEKIKLRRIAANFGYPVTKMTKDEIHYKDV